MISFCLHDKGPNRTVLRDGKLYDCASFQLLCKRGGVTPPATHSNGDAKQTTDEDKTKPTTSDSPQTVKQETDVEMVTIPKDDTSEKDTASNIDTA